MKFWVNIVAIPLVSFLIMGVFLMLPAEEHAEADEREAPIEEQTVTLLFVGDMMFDRYVRSRLDANNMAFLLGEMRAPIETADLAAGNLEGPITTERSVSQGTAVGAADNTRFTFAPPVASMLSAYGFDVVSIGNNHIRDFGTSGVESTKRFLDAAGLAYTGDPTGASSEPVVKEVRGVRVAFVSYNEFTPNDADRAVAAVREGRRVADIVVVQSHWGEEYTSVPPLSVRAVAARFAEAGADMVIGTHSHVIGETETIGKTRVYYSLGNFIFDQYFSPEVQCGLAVTVSAKKGRGPVELTYKEEQMRLLRGGGIKLGCS